MRGVPPQSLAWRSAAVRDEAAGGAVHTCMLRKAFMVRAFMLRTRLCYESPDESLYYTSPLLHKPLFVPQKPRRGTASGDVDLVRSPPQRLARRSAAVRDDTAGCADHPPGNFTGDSDLTGHTVEYDPSIKCQLASRQRRWGRCPHFQSN